MDEDPYQWYLLKKYHPEYAAQLEPLLFVSLEQVGPFAGMRSSDIDLALKNMGGLQFETQCCVQCPWCGFSINKKSKYQQMPVSMARTILRRLSDLNMEGDRTTSFRMHPSNLQMLYYESDPFDYRMPLEVGSSTFYYYPEMHVMANGYLDRSPYVSTAVPKGKEDKVLEFIDRGLHRYTQLRLSYSDHNSERLLKPDSKTGKSFDSELQKRLDEERAHLIWELEVETQIVSSSIEDHWVARLHDAQRALKQKGSARFLRSDPRDPKRLLLSDVDFELIHSLASLPKEKLLEELKNERTRAYLKEVLPIISLLEHSKFSYTQGPIYIQDTQVREVGRAFDSEASRDETVPGIGCFDGVLVTPTKLYNLVQLPAPTPEFKDGQVVVELSKTPPQEQLPMEAPIQDILKFGVVESKGAGEIIAKPAKERRSFYLLDFQGNRHLYVFNQVGDGYVANRRFDGHLKKSVETNP